MKRKRNFRIWLRSARKKANLTREQLAAKIEVTPAAVRNYENGLRNPRFNIFQAIQRAVKATFAVCIILVGQAAVAADPQPTPASAILCPASAISGTPCVAYANIDAQAWTWLTVPRVPMQSYAAGRVLVITPPLGTTAVELILATSEQSPSIPCLSQTTISFTDTQNPPLPLPTPDGTKRKVPSGKLWTVCVVPSLLTQQRPLTDILTNLDVARAVAAHSINFRWIDDATASPDLASYVTRAKSKGLPAVVIGDATQSDPTKTIVGVFTLTDAPTFQSLILSYTE